MDKPLATFALFAYNQEAFIRAAVEAALAQTYSPLEIILSDDGSKDRTFEIMQEMAAAYRGPHHVIVRRNVPNLGLAGHVNTVFAIAKGEFIVSAAGDDISLPWRTENLVNHFLDYPDCVLAGSHSQVFGDYHHISALLVDPDCKNLLTRCRSISEGIQGCSLAYRRRLIESFPPLEKTTQIEDVTFAFRAWEIGTFEVLPEVLVLYRTHNTNLSITTNKLESIAYQVKMHCSVLDQMCIDIKRMNRSYAEIVPALIFLRKRELFLLESLIWHQHPSFVHRLKIAWAVSKIRKFLTKESLWKTIRRRRERKALHAKVIANWHEVLRSNQGSRCLPASIRELLKSEGIS